MEDDERQKIAAGIKAFLESSPGEVLRKLVSIEYFFDHYSTRDVFSVLAQLKPNLVSRLDITSNTKDFYDGFHYGIHSVEELGKFCIENNNAGLLSLLSRDFPSLPDDYRIAFEMRNAAVEEDARLLYTKMLAELSSKASTSIVNVSIKNPNYKLLLALGIVPRPGMRGATKLMRFYKEGRSEDDLRFWTGLPTYARLNDVGIWCMFKLEFLEWYRMRANSYPFLFTYPGELYKSYRPKTNMNLFRLPNSRSYKKIKEVENFLPVVRYAKSMSGSMFFDDDERPTSICGRFYYYEPESETLLLHRKDAVLHAFNKVDMYHKIYERVKALDKKLAAWLKKEYEIIIKPPAHRQVELHRQGLLRKDLQYTTAEAYVFFDLEYADKSGDIPPGVWNNNDKGDKFYLGDALGMYAAEDDLDQPLCVAGKLLGYDLLVFENMIGSHQVVSEVLDTREDSFQHLIFKA